MTELGIERPIVGLIHTILTKEAGTKVVAYADDVVILMQGKFPQTLCNLMETALSSLSSNQAKYLGVILDKKLLWAENIADRTRKAAIALFAFRPILLYGIIVWWHSLEKNCNLKNLNKIQRSAELCIKWDHLPHQIENAVNIYTDGSKLNLQTGGGVFSPELDIKVSFRLPDHCSVFQAEVMAIQEAMSYLDTTKHCNTDIFIFSDSQAALRALDSYSTNSLTISECRKSLNEMATHLRISLIWVPGHRNIEGNCIADELARQGTTTDILRDKDTVGMPIATCKLLLKQRLYTLSNNRWNTIPTCHTSRLTWGTHARRLGLSSYDYCRSCKQIEEEENIEHLLCFCPAHNLKRFQTLGSYTLPNLAAIQGTSIPKLLCFLKRTNWFEKPNNP
ncbi:uncharacterized protein [Drosophila takahashii]|uniref:uncharacterized protein n=1 Tax=Drosophila takahashii TaxID=29030 RepID=UPI003898FBF1